MKSSSPDGNLSEERTVRCMASGKETRKLMEILRDLGVGGGERGGGGVAVLNDEDCSKVWLKEDRQGCGAAGAGAQYIQSWGR